MPIQAIIIGGNEAAVQMAGDLQDSGIWVPAIRPPTVPAGTARLRVSLSAAHSGQDVSQLAQALVRLLR